MKKMRDFFEVISELKNLAGTKDFKARLEEIELKAHTTPADYVWDWRGREVSDLIFNACHQPEIMQSEWIVKVFMYFTEKDQTFAREYIQKIYNSQFLRK